MPSPSASLATLRPELAASLMEFELAQDRQGFIAQQVLPVIEVAKSSGKYGLIPIEQLLQSPETRRAPGSGYARGNWKFADASFATEEHGWEEPIDDREASLYAEYFDAEVISAARAQDFVLRNAEIRAAAAVFNTSTWTGGTLTTAITNEWDDTSNATPIADIRAAKQAVWDLCGMWPNVVIMNRKVFNNGRACDDIKDNVASAGAGKSEVASDITEAQMAMCFDVDRIIVAGSAKNTANEGQASSLSSIWSDEYIMVARIATSNDMKEPGLGRTFHWGEDGSSIGGTLETYRDESIRGDVVRYRHDVDEIISYTECGHLLSNATT